MKKKFLDYELTVYQCAGTSDEKLEWFRTINIAGENLTEQELRNAVYHGSFIGDAKRYFSKTSCVAHQFAGDYLNGVAIRQDYLETVLKWIAHRDDYPNNQAIEHYMMDHQQDNDASELWQYFQEVFAWVTRTFSNTNKERKKLMKGQEWGIYYNEHKHQKFNAKELEKRIISLIDDDEVDNKRGIYPYLLTGQERYLSLRTFSDKDKQKMYQKQNGICKACKHKFELAHMDADHIIPWSQGGKTTLENGQLLCKVCNRHKSDR